MMMRTNQFRSVFPILVALLCLFAFGDTRAETADISIHIQERQASGLPWRGPAIPNLMYGALIFGQLHSTAPSAILCIVRQTPGLYCQKAVQGDLKSPCPLSFDCSFEDVQLPADEVFGLMFLNQGMMNRGLVDAVLLTRSHLTRHDPAVAAMDQIVRDAAARLAPPNTTEVSRRSRRWSIMELRECESRCDLTQSRIKVESAQ
jgi:hypothetical protein